VRAVSLVAAASLVVGFAVAQATGVRSLGGLVLLAAVSWCCLRWRRAAGWPMAVGLVLLYVTAFVGSHLLARVIGAWPSVLTVAAVVGLASLAATRRTLAHDGRG
jgi:multisubunit Na+/H+ antiporter MnhG subunit